VVIKIVFMWVTSPNFQAAVFVVAVAGLATNVAFFDQQGPVFVKSTAVPIWLTLLLSLNSFPSGSSSSKGTGTARRVLSRVNVFLSFFLLVCFLLSRIANAWPWTLLLTVLLTFEARGQHQRTVLNQQSCLPLSETQQHQRLPQSLSETLLPDSNSQPTPHHPHEGNNKGIIGQESCVEEAKENKKKNPLASTTATTTTTTTTTRSSSLGPLAKDVFSLVLLALLSLGGAVQLNWSLRYMYSPEARGMQRSDVVLGNGRTLSLYWHCEGGYDGDGSDSGSSSGISSSNNGAVGGGGSASSRASNTRGSNSSNSGSVVTHMLNADASHGAADLWPLQRELTVRGLRSCVFDKPGQGWADNYAPDQAMDFSTTAMALLFEAMKEPAPYRLVGWGGGAADMYSYAKNRPEDVEGLVFLDAYSDAVEWRSWAYGNGASVEEMMDYRASDLASRKTSFTLIRLALVPFGLSPLLFRPDPSSYALPELFDVYRYFYWLDKVIGWVVSGSYSGWVTKVGGWVVGGE
jgi:pimeloyl-ACP methyl ester carboxylesterase